jgi:hypothetical protein
VTRTEVILAELEAASAELSAVVADVTGDVHVAAFPSAERALLAPAIAALAGRHPDVPFHANDFGVLAACPGSRWRVRPGCRRAAGRRRAGRAADLRRGATGRAGAAGVGGDGRCASPGRRSVTRVIRASPVDPAERAGEDGVPGDLGPVAEAT